MSTFFDLPGSVEEKQAKCRHCGFVNHYWQMPSLDERIHPERCHGCGEAGVWWEVPVGKPPE
jgi:NAD-dependent SIR2 family protein deacetylase